MPDSDKWSIPDRRELSKGVRVKVHAEGGKIFKATILGEPTRAEYPLILQDGTKMVAKKGTLELDSEGARLPTAGVFKQHGVSLKFMILQGEERASLCTKIADHGGQVVTKEGPDVIVIHSGSEALVPLCSSAVHSKRLIHDALKPGASFPSMDGYVLREAPGTSTKSSGFRTKYSIAEDRRLLDFVKENCTKYGVKGQKLWQEAERLKVTGRSWQSMREHYIKTLEREYEAQQKKAAKEGKKRSGADDDPIASESEPPSKQISPRKKPRVTEPEKGGAVGSTDPGADHRQPPKSAAGVTDDKDPPPMSESMKWRTNYVAKVEELMKTYNVKKAVVIHAFIVFSGELVKAEKYLSGQMTPEEEDGAWSFQDDDVLIKTEEEDFQRPRRQLANIIQKRTLEGAKSRYDWIHLCDTDSDAEDAEGDAG